MNYNRSIKRKVLNCTMNNYTSQLTLTLLVWRQEQPEKMSDVSDVSAGVVICLERDANDLHMVQLMPLPIHHLLLQRLVAGPLLALIGQALLLALPLFCLQTDFSSISY